MRVSKAIAIKEGYNLELMLNVFNIANHQNIDGINSTAYEILRQSSTSEHAHLSAFFPRHHQFQQQRFPLHAA